MLKKFSPWLFLLLVPWPAFAQNVIEFPDEELARESVLPKFDRPEKVLDRHIITAKRLEVGGFGGWILTDPFWNANGIGGYLTYHFDEVSGLNLMGYYRFQGLTSQANQIDSTSATNVYINNAPEPSALLMASYQFTAFYGKLSIAKSTVANLSTFGLLGLGAYAIGNATEPTLGLGIGQKYYFSPSFALRLELRELIYNGPDILSRNMSGGKIPASNFDQKLEFDTMASIGAVYLLPAF